jgi:hypothetical protein
VFRVSGNTRKQQLVLSALVKLLFYDPLAVSMASRNSLVQDMHEYELWATTNVPKGEIVSVEKLLSAFQRGELRGRYFPPSDQRTPFKSYE